ncbi:hypothetical protein OOK27_16745 [Streptomyces canus]|uniref:hypothetical protein n=1 Tax=Streptomyces canus TaxID=58343 RepID=UPI00224F666D|nr:hypothetical protein [Streptomyces canus]MCX5255769.1 hypothetical protein [Streptomyces canus]
MTIATTGTADAPVTFIAAPGNGSAVKVVGQRTTAITFSGAQYVDMAGIRASASGATALALADSQHITYRSATVLATATPPGISVDSSSSGIKLTRDLVSTLLGLGFASAAGAQDITLADDRFDSGAAGGISAVGTTDIHLAGDTVMTVCGSAVNLTGGTSGSVENTVAMPGGTTTCSSTGTPAEFTLDAASAAQVTADYNAVNPLSTGTDYDWAGTTYATSRALQAGTIGQGAHDLGQTDLTIPLEGRPTEHPRSSTRAPQDPQRRGSPLSMPRHSRVCAMSLGSCGDLRAVRALTWANSGSVASSGLTALPWFPLLTARSGAVVVRRPERCRHARLAPENFGQWDRAPGGRR